jgi:hypothetical protein
MTHRDTNRSFWLEIYPPRLCTALTALKYVPAGGFERFHDNS